MNQLNERSELENTMKHQENLIIFVFTPACGTCKLARNFLSVFENMEDVPEMYELDINYFRGEAENWEIKSVPCLMYFKKSKLMNKMYALESVTKIYQFIKSETNN